MKEKTGLQSSVTVADDANFGFPNGTRLISVQSGAFYKLLIVNDNGKYKIVWATIEPPVKN